MISVFEWILENARNRTVVQHNKLRFIKYVRTHTAYDSLKDAKELVDAFIHNEGAKTWYDVLDFFLYRTSALSNELNRIFQDNLFESNKSLLIEILSRYRCDDDIDKATDALEECETWKHVFTLFGLTLPKDASQDSPIKDSPIKDYPEINKLRIDIGLIEQTWYLYFDSPQAAIYAYMRKQVSPKG